VIVVSTDKDLWALMSHRIHVHRSVKQQYSESDVLEQYGVMPNKISLHKAMFGDSSDGLPKFDGRRVRKGALVVEAIRNSTTVDELYVYLEQLFRDNDQAWSALQEFRDQADINFFAANLRTDLDLDVGICHGDAQSLRELLAHYECSSLIDIAPDLVKAIEVDDPLWTEWSLRDS